MFPLLLPLGVVCVPSPRSLPRLAAAVPLLAVPLVGRGPIPARGFGFWCRLRFWRLGVAVAALSFLLFWGVLGVGLFCWFSAFCVFFFSFFSCFVLFFFVALSHVWCWFPRFLPVSLGYVRGSFVRVVARVRLVRAVRVACARFAWLAAVRARRRRLPALRFLALWAPWVFLVC